MTFNADNLTADEIGHIWYALKGLVMPWTKEAHKYGSGNHWVRYDGMGNVVARVTDQVLKVSPRDNMDTPFVSWEVGVYGSANGYHAEDLIVVVPEGEERPVRALAKAIQTAKARADRHLFVESVWATCHQLTKGDIMAPFWLGGEDRANNRPVC